MVIVEYSCGKPLTTSSYWTIKENKVEKARRNLILELKFIFADNYRQQNDTPNIICELNFSIKFESVYSSIVVVYFI